MTVLQSKQCLLEKGTTHKVAWIPAKFAVLGKVIDLNEYGEWSDGWTVMWVSKGQPQGFIEARERDYRKQRLVSDV